jgi:hypothetical protein
MEGYMRKVLIVLLSICFLLTTSASVIGYMESKKTVEPDNPTPVTPTPSGLVKYEYYLENEKQETMPTNNIDSEVKYMFSKHLCTNGLTGSFDTTLWKFTPSEEKEALCSLYFVKSQYEVTITTSNGSVQNSEDGKFLVPRENEGQFNVIPNEGYKYKNVVCSNDNEAIYDISSNTLTISSVMENIACKVNFEIMKFKAKVTVVNGTGNTTETEKYGNDVNVIVKAKDGYEKPTVKCTNNQTGSIKNNTLTIYKITDNTTCTVTYKKIPTVLFTLKITSLPDTVTIVSGNTSQSIKKGTDGKISLKPDSGYNVSINCNVKPSSTTTDPDGTVNYTFLNVEKNITCSVSSSEL